MKILKGKNPITKKKGKSKERIGKQRYEGKPSLRKEIQNAYRTDFSNYETIERKPLNEEKKRRV